MKLLVWLFSVSALVLAAVCIFVLVRYDIALLAAVSCLAVALIVSAAASIPSDGDGNTRLNNVLSQRLGKNTNDIESLSRRIADQAQRLSDLGSRLDAGKSHQGARDNGRTHQLTPTAQHPAAQRPAAKTQPPAVRPSHAPTRLAPARIQRPQPVQLFLEPVVRLAEGRTAYYKASFRLRDQSPADLTHIVASADLPVLNGQSSLWDPALDAQLLQQILPLLEKLRARRGATGIFCPISVATLESTKALQELVGLLQANPEGAAGIVLDIHHTALAGLSEAGLQGLAWLASLGATFCLTGDGMLYDELPSLSELGFAFIDVPGEGLTQPAQPGMTAEELLHVTQANNIALIASGVEQPDNASSLMHASSLGRGPGFSSPRAVRERALHSSSAAQVA
jgi:EAL domain-containing protein (putative c-di-GMP-specific phosphodiesterase class I)